MPKSSYKPGRYIPRYGHTYLTIPQSTALNSVNWTKISGTSVFNSSYDFDMPANCCTRYIGSAPEDFFVNISVSGESDTSNALVHYGIAVNGIVVTSSVVDRHHVTIGNHGSVSVNMIEELHKNDVVSLYCMCNKPINFTAVHFTLVVMRT